jgi:hypothetical protein
MSRTLAAVIAAGTLLFAGSAWSAEEPDELMPGRFMVVKKATTQGSARPKLVTFVARAPEGVSFALPDEAHNPRIEGATLRVFDVGGGADDTYPLPADGWRALGVPPGSRGYMYRGVGVFVAPASDPCHRVVITPRIVRAICTGAAVHLGVPFAGDRGVVLQVGTSSKRYCARFGGEPKGDADSVYLRTNAPPPESCPTP